MTPSQPLSVLVIDDEPVLHDTLGPYLRECGHRVEHATDGRQGLRALDADRFDLALVDIRMPGVDGIEVLIEATRSQPDLPIVIMTGHGTLEYAVRALRGGATDFLAKPIKLAELDAILDKCKRIRKLQRDARRLGETMRREQARAHATSTLIGDSSQLAEVRELIARAVAADCRTILVLGETGTGKEIVAREFHALRYGDDHPFIAVNCPSLPESLVESELFGHEKGAFTGAHERRIGHFELASGGTLFLDEIADLTAAAQAKLLRAIESRRIQRVGGTREVEVDVTIVAATHTSLHELVEQGTFRRDLLYRLEVFPIRLPALRDHRDDIPRLVEHFLARGDTTRRPAPKPTAAALAALRDYAFPGNVRELRNIVERATILAAGTPTIDVAHLGLSPTASAVPDTDAESPRDAALRRRLVDALEQTRWNRRRAAELLAMPYSTLRHNLRRLGIG